jgi:glycerol uptake facilitator-like aquaporin
MTYSLTKRMAAEFAGTAALVATVVGSGVMADKLSNGNVGIALLANCLATGIILFVLIAALGEFSSAHYNPAVTLAMAAKGAFPVREVLPYSVAQIAGGIAGTMIAQVMFGLPVIEWSHHARNGVGTLVGEAVATFGLLCVIEMCGKRKLECVAASVGMYVAAAIWFTSSTSFANPAVTIARSFTDTFAGIRPADILPFIAAQVVGALAGVGFCGWLTREEKPAVCTAAQSEV